MRAWPCPQIPQVVGSAPPLRLFDTATNQLAPTSTGPTARMYVCGITPYDATHLGHAATYLAFDVLNRVWRDAGYRVEYVQNVTDIDDPLLERAVANGQDWRKLADEETETFRDDMAALQIVPPDHYIGAVESIPAIVTDIQQLQRDGCVYSVGEDLYFDLSRQPRFGSVANLSHLDMLTLFAERGGDPDRPGKRQPLDPLLWQAARPDEPCWDTELGHGRPGWHIECTAIASEYLGQPFDVQGGGSDLAFPHHEMSAALGEASDEGWPFARRYVHAGMVGYQGHKMSKSLGNLVLVRELRAAGVDPMAIRLALFAHHYRSDWEWTAADLTSASERLTTWRAAMTLTTGPSAAATIAEVRTRLADDLAVPDAVAAVDSWATLALAGRGSDPAAPRELATAVHGLLGIALA